tara:strand:+ start:911 stop:1147 length:237 start_codon:yes stop_codon:yes gene_type:complete
MKTAISIPDEIFDAAEELSKRLNLSRSELYSTAISDYVRSRHNEAVTEALNKVYEKEESSLNPIIDAMQQNSLPKEKW